MKRTLSALVVTAGFLAGCQTAPVTTEAAAAPGAVYQLNPAEVALVQSGVRSNLKDPGSAIFSGPTLAAKSGDGAIVACGTVNAKNSYGGYVGASPYIAKLVGQAVVDSTSASGDEARFVITMCRQAGVPI